jgi:hypothetical protein
LWSEPTLLGPRLLGSADRDVPCALTGPLPPQPPRPGKRYNKATLFHGCRRSNRSNYDLSEALVERRYRRSRSVPIANRICGRRIDLQAKRTTSIFGRGKWKKLAKSTVGWAIRNRTLPVHGNQNRTDPAHELWPGLLRSGGAPLVAVVKPANLRYRNQGAAFCECLAEVRARPWLARGASCDS